MRDKIFHSGCCNGSAGRHQLGQHSMPQTNGQLSEDVWRMPEKFRPRTAPTVLKLKLRTVQPARWPRRRTAPILRQTARKQKQLRLLSSTMKNSDKGPELLTGSGPFLFYIADEWHPETCSVSPAPLQIPSVHTTCYPRDAGVRARTSAALSVVAIDQL